MKDSYRWLLFIITGFLLIFLLGLHMGVMHLHDLFAFAYRLPAGSETLDWTAVIYRAKEISTLVLYIVFLLLALFHGLYGLWNILIEAFAKKKIEKPLGWVLTLIGITLFVYGAYTTYLTYLQKTL